MKSFQCLSQQPRPLPKSSFRLFSLFRLQSAVSHRRAFVMCVSCVCIRLYGTINSCILFWQQTLLLSTCHLLAQFSLSIFQLFVLLFILKISTAISTANTCQFADYSSSRLDAFTQLMSNWGMDYQWRWPSIRSLGSESRFVPHGVYLFVKSLWTWRSWSHLKCSSLVFSTSWSHTITTNKLLCVKSVTSTVFCMQMSLSQHHLSSHVALSPFHHKLIQFYNSLIFYFNLLGF